MLITACFMVFGYGAFYEIAKHPPKAIQNAATSGIETLERTQNGQILLSDLTGRNLFKPLITAPVAHKIVVLPPVAPPVPKIPISQKAARFHLVGIIPGDPTQAIIEDAQTHSTIYAAAGQKIDDIQVSKILSDRVVLTCEDDQMDLML